MKQLTEAKFLEKLDLSHDEFIALLRTYDSVTSKATQKQRNAIRRTLPTTADAVAGRWFGPGVTEAQLNKIIEKLASELGAAGNEGFAGTKFLSYPPGLGGGPGIPGPPPSEE